MDATAAADRLLIPALRLAASATIAVALPLFLIANSVRSVALGEEFYLEEFARYGVGHVTGLSPDELRRIAHAFVVYFESEPERVDITVSSAQGPQALFNEREIRHMEDVQGLIQRVLEGRTLALVAMVAGGLALVALDRHRAGQALAQAGALGGGVTVLALGAVGVAALLDFRQLFLQFHLVSFANDLWMLDPTRDRLIQLFPQGFFFDAATRIGIQAIGLGAAIASLSVGALWLTRNQDSARSV